MNKTLLLFFLSLSLAGCTVKEVPLTDPHTASQMVNIFAAKMQAEQGMELLDSSMFHDRYLNRIRLDFASQKIVDLCQARELLVTIAQDFINHANSGELSPFLASDIFTADNLELYIKFESFYNRYVDPRRIGFMFLRDGISYFYAADTLDCDRNCWHERREYFWQSEDFVEFSRQGQEIYGTADKEKKLLEARRTNSWISFENEKEKRKK
jgi:hypothetical protein